MAKNFRIDLRIRLEALNTLVKQNRDVELQAKALIEYAYIYWFKKAYEKAQNLLNQISEMDVSDQMKKKALHMSILIQRSHDLSVWQTPT